MIGLAALTPRPRINLVLNYGVLGPRAAWRRRVCPDPSADADTSPGDDRASTTPAAMKPERHHRNLLWAELMRRSFPPSLDAIRAELRRDLAGARRVGGRLRSTG